MNFSYKFTVFTPCYNSEKFISRVYESLLKQTFKDFEWLVINDNSTDNTIELIREFIKKADFDINLIDLNENQMLTKNYNLASKNAKGEFFLPLGHDDALTSDALKTFMEYWDKIPDSEKMFFSGITCTCVDQYGHPVGDKYPESPYISDFFHTVYDLKIKGEKQGIIKTEIMREFPIPEIDIYVPEGIAWHHIGEKYKTLYINENLRIYYINQPHESLSSTASKKIKYPKGICFYSLCLINRFFKKINKNYIFKIKTILNYGRMSIHSKKNLRTAAKDILIPLYRYVYYLIYPVSYLISYKDKFLKYI